MSSIQFLLYLKVSVPWRLIVTVNDIYRDDWSSFKRKVIGETFLEKSRGFSYFLPRHVLLFFRLLSRLAVRSYRPRLEEGDAFEAMTGHTVFIYRLLVEFFLGFSSQPLVSPHFCP